MLWILKTHFSLQDIRCTSLTPNAISFSHKSSYSAVASAGSAFGQARGERERERERERESHAESVRKKSEGKRYSSATYFFLKQQTPAFLQQQIPTTIQITTQRIIRIRRTMSPGNVSMSQICCHGITRMTSKPRLSMNSQ